MEKVKRIFFEEYDAGCLYHPKDGCVHPSNSPTANFISSLVNRWEHAPTLDVDFPTTIEDVEGGSFRVAISGPGPERKHLDALLDACVSCNIMAPESAEHARRNSDDGDGPAPLPPLVFTVPTWLTPSSTPGHFHLYIDHVLSWEAYKGLLLALRDAGVIGPDFCGMSTTWRVSFLLKPGFTKQDLKVRFPSP